MTHEEAGLVFSGYNADGQKEWIGTQEQWDKVTVEDINLGLPAEEEYLALKQEKAQRKLDIWNDIDDNSDKEEISCSYLYTKPKNEMTNSELDKWYEINQANQD